MSAGLQVRRWGKAARCRAARRAVWRCAFRAGREGAVRVSVRSVESMVQVGGWRMGRKESIVEGRMRPRGVPGLVESSSR